jgi:SPP1 family predicted phage head-tail adaptor
MDGDAMNLRHVITFEQLVYPETDYDDLPPTWESAFNVRAKFESVSASETQQDEQVHQVTTHRLRVRYDKRITDDMRIKLGTRTLSIESVTNENERNRWLLIDAHEVT